jgi:pyruvate dehydrogenase (quinone)
MVKLEMLVEGIPDYATDQAKVNYSDIARAVGLDAVRIEEGQDLRDGLVEGLSRPGPTLIEVVTDPNALSMPSNMTSKQVIGFAEAASKKILGGGVGKMIEMARSNLRNIPRP